MDREKIKLTFLTVPHRGSAVNLTLHPVGRGLPAVPCAARRKKSLPLWGRYFSTFSTEFSTIAGKERSAVVESSHPDKLKT